jgi:hypothetical protein
LAQTSFHLDEVARAVRVEHLLDLPQPELRQMLHPDSEFLREWLALDRQSPARDVLSEVGDPLQVAGNADRGDDLAQVHRHRLAPGDHQDRPLLDDPVQLVYLLVGLDHVVSEVGVGAQQSEDRALHQLLGVAAHLGDGAGKAAKIILERGDDVLCHKGNPQPKRPVM